MYENRNTNRRRDRYDIIAEMLRVAKVGKLKTHIMYELKLSYPQIAEYLPTLVEKGFLENKTVKRGKRETAVYRTTLKGIDLLVCLESVDKLWTEHRVRI